MGADAAAFATAGIAATRGRMLRAFSVRKEVKDHGGGGRIAGPWSRATGWRSPRTRSPRGVSMLEAADVIREAGPSRCCSCRSSTAGGTVAAMAADGGPGGPGPGHRSPTSASPSKAAPDQGPSTVGGLPRFWVRVSDREDSQNYTPNTAGTGRPERGTGRSAGEAAADPVGEHGVDDRSMAFDLDARRRPPRSVSVAWRALPVDRPNVSAIVPNSGSPWASSRMVACSEALNPLNTASQARCVSFAQEAQRRGPVLRRRLSVGAHRPPARRRRAAWSGRDRRR